MTAMQKCLLVLFDCLILSPLLVKPNEGSSNGKDSLVAVLDLAKKSFLDIRGLIQQCGNSTRECGNVCPRDIKQKSESHIKVAVNLIRQAKRRFTATNAAPTRKPSHSPPAPPEPLPPMDCDDILERGKNASGVYTIHLRMPEAENKTLNVYCDMETDGGGWTVLQRRDNYTVQENFFRGWNSYKKGFGSVTKDFWLGNNNIHFLSHQAEYYVRFDLEAVDGEKRYAHYDYFRVDSERDDYKLYIYSYKGDAGNSMSHEHGMKFSTVYKDNDEADDNNCASTAQSGWWFSNCAGANLNGVYGASKHSVGVDEWGIKIRCVYWFDFREYEPLKSVEMKIKRKRSG